MEAVEGCYAARHCRLSFVISDWLPSSERGRSYLIRAGPRRESDGSVTVTGRRWWTTNPQVLRLSFVFVNLNESQPSVSSVLQKGMMPDLVHITQGSERPCWEARDSNHVTLMLHIHNDREKHAFGGAAHFQSSASWGAVTQIYLTPRWTASLQLV